MTFVPTPEDYEIWREHPVTAWVLAGMQTYADHVAELGMTHAWQSKDVDLTFLGELKIRADDYEGFATLSYDDACGLHLESDVPQEEPDASEGP